MTIYKTPSGTKYELVRDYRIKVWLDRGPIAAWSTILSGTIGYTIFVAAFAIFISSFFWWLLAGLPIVCGIAMLLACHNCDDLHMNFFHQQTRVVDHNSYIHPKYLDHPVYAEMIGDLVDDVKSGGFDSKWWTKQLDSTNQEMHNLEIAKKESLRKIRKDDYNSRLEIEAQVLQGKLDA